MATNLVKRKLAGSDQEGNEQGSVKRSRYQYDFSKTITVLVGKTEKTFVLHEDALVSRSGFFKAACSRGWKEAEEKIVRLPDVDPVVFQRFAAWVYEMYGASYEIDSLNPAICLSVPATIRLCELWTVADYFQAPAFKCYIMNTLLGSELPSEFIVMLDPELWAKVPLTSGLGMWLVDYIVASATLMRHSLETAGEAIPQGVLLAVLKRFAANDLRQHQGRAPTLEDRCKYHEHAEGEDWCTKESE